MNFVGREFDKDVADRGEGNPECRTLEMSMLTETQPESRSPLKNPLLYTSLAIGIALLYVGWIFFYRWVENRGLEQRAAQEKAEKQREEDRTSVEQMGGKDLTIQNFYAAPNTIHRGETAKLCYGVANAKKVRLEPQSNSVWPSFSRCVDVSPTATTTYTLTIEDAGGKTKSQTLEVKVE